MSGQGRLVERPFTAAERAALGAALPALGETDTARRIAAILRSRGIGVE